MSTPYIPPPSLPYIAAYRVCVCVCVCVCGYYQDQYIFIHDAILEAVTCGDTQIESGNLRAKLNKLQKKDQSGKTELELQFAVSINFVV